MVTIEFREDQLDLIVLAMERVRMMTDGEAPAYTVDRLGRLFLKRRCQEVIALVQANYPEAGN